MRTRYILIVLACIFILVIGNVSIHSYSINSRIGVHSETMNRDSIMHQSDISDYYLIFHGIDYQTKTSNAGIPIDVYIDKKTTVSLLRFMPFYKPVKLKSRVTYRWNIPGHNPSTENKNSFEIEGKYVVKGLSSSKMVSQNISALINQNIVNHITKEIDFVLKPYTND